MSTWLGRQQEYGVTGSLSSLLLLEISKKKQVFNFKLPQALPIEISKKQFQTFSIFKIHLRRIDSRPGNFK